MGRINGEDYQEARESISIISILNHYGYYSKDKKYSCPFHSEKTPSASVKNNRLKCFGCGKVATTIDIVMELEGVDQFTAIRKLLDKDVIFRASKEENKAPLQSEEKEKTIQERYEEQLSYSRPVDKTNIGYIKKYFNGRCIPEALELTKELNNIEILHNFYNKQNFIIYNFPKYNFMIKKAIDGSCKLFYGSPRPVYFKMNNSFDWYVCEGIEDCFSLLLVQQVNAVCLNSTSNINKFTEAVRKKHSENINFIIATDNDGNEEKGGVMAKNKLIRFFTENNIKYDLYTKFYDYAKKYNLKDVNECLCHSRKGGIKIE